MKIACYIRNIGIFDQLRATLIRTGFECDHFLSKTTLLRALRRYSFDLIVIDIAIDSHDNDNDSIFSWLNFRSDDRPPRNDPFRDLQRRTGCLGTRQRR